MEAHALIKRTPEAQMAYLEGYKAGLILAKIRLQEPDTTIKGTIRSIEAYITGVEYAMTQRKEQVPQ
jgi:hypothetical protein